MKNLPTDEDWEKEFDKWRDTQGGWPSRTECFEWFLEQIHTRDTLIKETIEDGQFEITPVKESMAAGMSLQEAEGTYCYADGYNQALSDLKACLFPDT